MPLIFQPVKLDLSKNKLNGQLPTGMGKLNSLEHCSFSDNRFTGHVPDDFSNLVNLGMFQRLFIYPVCRET